MTITIHKDVDQGSPTWHELRRGMLTASRIDDLITPAKLLPSKQRTPYLLELLAEEISGNVEAGYLNADMERGYDAEEAARAKYEETYEPIERVGFIVNDELGFPVGYSPDFACLSGKGGGEVKGPNGKIHLDNILNQPHLTKHRLQVQCGLWVTKWDFVDLITFHAGLPMFTIRVLPDPTVQAAIVAALIEANAERSTLRATYHAMMSSTDFRLVPTVRESLEVIA